ncbi:MAG: methyltransferase domain-containing protein [Longimicrobiales bacterium]
MDFQGIDIVCPACHADLAREGGEREGRLHCTACSRTYPIEVGIPDLRLWPDPYIGFDADRAKGRMLDEHAVQLDFASAVRFYYSVTEKVPPFQAQRFVRGLLAAAPRARHSMERWGQRTGGDPGSLALLDIGCGTAPLLASASPRYARVAGVDIAFRWLVLARRRLADAGVDAPLLCACAEALPFPPRAFDRIVADSTIEHVRAPADALRECARVLKPDGWLAGATPNRFSLGPDPHVGLPAGGYLPKGIIAAYVRRKGGIPPQRTLFSVRSLEQILIAAGFDDIEVWSPDVPAAQLAGFGRAARAGIGVYNRAVQLAPGRFVLDRIGPLLHMIARRNADEPAGDACDDGSNPPA